MFIAHCRCRLVPAPESRLPTTPHTPYTYGSTQYGRSVPKSVLGEPLVRGTDNATTFDSGSWDFKAELVLSPSTNLAFGSRDSGEARADAELRPDNQVNRTGSQRLQARHFGMRGFPVPVRVPECSADACRLQVRRAWACAVGSGTEYSAQSTWLFQSLYQCLLLLCSLIVNFPSGLRMCMSQNYCCTAQYSSHTSGLDSP